MGYKTIYNYAVDKENPEYKGPLNYLFCAARLFTPEDKVEMKDKMGMEKTDSMTEKKHNKMDKDKMQETMPMKGAKN